MNNRELAIKGYQLGEHKIDVFGSWSVCEKRMRWEYVLTVNFYTEDNDFIQYIDGFYNKFNQKDFFEMISFLDSQSENPITFKNSLKTSNYFIELIQNHFEKYEPSCSPEDSFYGI